MGLPCFTQVTWDDLAPAYYTGSPFGPCATLWSWATDCMPVGSSLSASLACSSLRCLKQFTWVGLVIQPEPPTALTLAVAEASSRSPPGPKAEGCCHGSFQPDRYQSRWCRWATANGIAGSIYGGFFIANNYLSDFTSHPTVDYK